jgi:hypothetical protein
MSILSFASSRTSLYDCQVISSFGSVLYGILFLYAMLPNIFLHFVERIYLFSSSMLHAQCHSLNNSILFRNLLF